MYGVSLGDYDLSSGSDFSCHEIRNYDDQDQGPGERWRIRARLCVCQVQALVSFMRKNACGPAGHDRCSGRIQQRRNRARCRGGRDDLGKIGKGFMQVCSDETNWEGGLEKD